MTNPKKKKNGTDNTKQRIVSISAINKADDGSFVFIGKSRLLRPVRHRKSKANNIR